MKRPSVLFVNRVYPPMRGATGRVLHDLARSFAREGWRVDIVTTGAQNIQERDGAIRITRVKAPKKPSGLFSYIATWLKLYRKALRQDKPDLLVTLTDPPLLAKLGQIISQKKGCRHIHWCQDLYPDILPALGVNFPLAMQNMLKDISYDAMKSADKLIVIGRCMARHLVYNGVNPTHITMIPNWPDAELSKHKDTKNAVKSEGASIKHYSDMAKPFDEQIKGTPKFRVLYAGNIGLAHPIETIMGAAEILHHENPEIEFVFVGDGARFDEIAKQRDIKRLDNIRLLPYQPKSHLRAIMESGDVHLVSMDDRAAGKMVPCKLYSALAVKRPCIFVGPAASEAAKIISDFKSGTVVAQGRPADLAARIKHYRLNSDEWFAAHNGALEAAKVYVPEDAMNAWIERAWAVVQKDISADQQALSKEKTRATGQKAA